MLLSSNQKNPFSSFTYFSEKKIFIIETECCFGENVTRNLFQVVKFFFKLQRGNYFNLFSMMIMLRFKDQIVD
jgi:hypothetical protein